MSFVTGILGTLTLATGRLHWICAGHPPPLLLRHQVAIAELECTPTLPFGLGGGEPVVSTAVLAPGDTALLYTDGVTEAHDQDRELFGIDRLARLLDQETAVEQEPEELLGTLIEAIIGHQAGNLRDDATILLLRLIPR
jgi:serine phosphatase RsbU (regulator of sigma subunit)